MYILTVNFRLKLDTSLKSFGFTLRRSDVVSKSVATDTITAATTMLVMLLVNSSRMFSLPPAAGMVTKFGEFIGLASRISIGWRI